jgi:hypothetical protein
MGRNATGWSFVAAAVAAAGRPSHLFVVVFVPRITPREQKTCYAQTLILVNLIFVKCIGVLVITRHHQGVKRPYSDRSFLSSPRTSLYLPGTSIQSLHLRTRFCMQNRKNITTMSFWHKSNPMMRLKNKHVKKSILRFLRLETRFQTWESGSREEISRRIQIWGQK